ncbi:MULTISPECIES: spermidine/putrescine ABC transporter ATP-binding protein PotA [Cobetia]|uniref:spermidine/putrescine ABC transporter ATP-binding protein PotA n=1 Tax=Cobetia TaxID=204286 RepID=UPI00086611F4|nr:MULTISPECIES: spermidine/putrescine ABC transporter ATP-binding protein PotA [Cobetia]AOM01459.1 putrescine/spermidine ABC transporter ATP-binding protein [Cobetia marina]AZV31375.1 spermidine/putrescine ABC transporter ATP-binding protein PotA [Cobetia sp. ICG0124]
MNSSAPETTPLVKLRSITKTFGERKVLDSLDLDLKDGEFVTLLGPSGCGKTTVLRLIAGFEDPDAGTITLENAALQHTPAHLRPVNTVFQSYALFPHMNLYDNVAFGLRMEKVPKAEIHERVREALEMVQLAHLSDRRPDQLSGGQQQRVAIARAVIKRPRVLLLDEPLSALDYKLRKQMQNELKRLQRRLGITFVFVTHDQEEALSMSDRVVVMREGGIEQIGTPREVYESPSTLFVARFVGEINQLAARVERPSTTPGRIHVEVLGKSLELSSHGREYLGGEAVQVLLRPEDMRLKSAEDSEGFAARVIERNYKGMTLDTVLELDSGQQLLASEFFDEDDPDFDYRLGERVKVSWVPDWEIILPDDAPVEAGT